MAKGIIVRRPRILKIAESLDLDGKALGTMQRLQRKYGDGPWLFSLFGKSYAVVTAAIDVRRVVENTPDPFSPAAPEKRAALSHFEPSVSLISVGQLREARRALNDRALESDRRVHSLGPCLENVVDAEMKTLLAGKQVLNWNDFHVSWNRLTRILVLGRSAAADEELTELLNELRSRANWGFLLPRKKRQIRRLQNRLADYLSNAETPSLAACLLANVDKAQQMPTHQMAQWPVRV